jgi:hypothetical protein
MRHLQLAALILLACNPPAPDAQTGGALAKKYKCSSCHGADLSGSDSPVGGSLAYAGNLTPDPTTGLGNWSDDEILGAIVLSDAGDACAVMPLYPLDETESSELLVYLRSLPPVVHDIPASDCAGPAPSDLDDAAVDDDAGTLIITNGS